MPLWRTLRTCSRGETFPVPPGTGGRSGSTPQDLPIIEGMDETEDRTEEIPEPYIIVRTSEGNVQDANSPRKST